MNKQEPNILLLMTDQQRGDCLGIDGHPVLQTPYLDHIGFSGTRFSSAYSACPVCIPARRTLMTGQKPVNHGVFVNYDTHLPAPTLPEELYKAGYQTHLVGKLHLYPKRKLYGFNSAQWADGPWYKDGEPENDYARFLRQSNVSIPLAPYAHGMDGNGWPARSWHLEEQLHISNWTADCALDFLKRRDPARPFFLKVSFFHPHTPCTPPEFYYNRYMNMDIPEPHIGEWAKVSDIPSRGIRIDSPRINLDPIVMKQFQAGYYGCINHIDNQIGRFLKWMPENTIIVFCSDHGDMLGDHGFSRKGLAYEGSARIPFLIKFPDSMGIEQSKVIDRPVELMDIMPTLLNAVGIPVPESVDGQSLIPLIRGDGNWREYIHGECAVLASMDNVLTTGMQYLTDGKRKYIWYPGTGVEQYFNIEDDPHELKDLSDDPDHRSEIGHWRSMLARELKGRPEGFTDGKILKQTNGPTQYFMPGYEREES